MATTMTTVDNILKEVYEGQITDQLQSEVISMARIERTSEGVETNSIGGKYTKFAVRVSRNHGVGARSEMEALPVAKTQGYRDSELNLKYLYGAIQLTGQVFELAQTNVQAFASALDQEVNGMKETLKKDVNRQVYGTNVGILATATGAGTTTTFVTTNAQYLEIGMEVDVYDSTDVNSSTVLNDAGVEITDITESAGTYTVTLDPAVTATATGDFLTRAGSRGKEKTGFRQIVLGLTDDHTDGDGTGALYNITHSVWTGNVDSTGGALSEGRMVAMVQKIRRRGGRTTVGFCDEGIQRAYYNLLVQQRRFNDTTEFAGGYSGLTFTTPDGQIPIVLDTDCQPETLWFMNEKKLKLYQAGDWSFMNRDGSNWNRVVTSDGTFDAYASHLFKYCEMGTKQRNTHGVLTDLTPA